MTLYQTEHTTFPRTVTWCYVLMVNPHSICPKYHGSVQTWGALIHKVYTCHVVWFALVGTRWDSPSSGCETGGQDPPFTSSTPHAEQARPRQPSGGWKTPFPKFISPTTKHEWTAFFDQSYLEVLVLKVPELWLEWKIEIECFLNRQNCVCLSPQFKPG